MNNNKIAVIGTFDVLNFGDLLFPSILKYFVSQYEVDKYSPRGSSGLGYGTENVFPLYELENKLANGVYDAIIIGGGDLLRMDDISTIQQCGYSQNETVRIMWQIPILWGARYGVPVIINAVGVPFPFKGSERKLVNQLLGICEYVSVRDELSKEYLIECGIHPYVVPDTVLSIDEVYPREFVDSVYEKIKKEKIIPVCDNYVVFQHNRVNIDDESYLLRIHDYLQQLASEKNVNVLLLPIGYVHSDQDFLSKIKDEDRRLFFVDKQLTPIEIAAVLANSCGYIGTSMHGAVVSLAYGKVAVCININNYRKITGLFQQIDHPELVICDISKLWNATDLIFNNTTVDITTCIKQIKDHFSKIVNIIGVKTDKRSEIDLMMLNLYYSLSDNSTEDAKIRFATIYYDYGAGYSESHSKKLQYTHLGSKNIVTFTLPERVMKIRIDPVENRYICASETTCLVNGIVLIPFNKNCVSYEENDLFVSYDPHYEYSVENVNAGSEFVFIIEADFIDEKYLMNVITNYHMQINFAREKIISLEYVEKEYDIILKKNSDTEKELFDTKNQNDKLNNDNNDLQETNNRLINDNNDLQETNSKLIESFNTSQEKIGELISENKKLSDNNDDLQNENNKLIEGYYTSQEKIDELKGQVELMKNTLGWKIYKPFKNAKDKVFFSMAKYPTTRRIRNAVSTLHHQGVKVFVRKLKAYRNKVRNINSYEDFCKINEAQINEPQNDRLIYDSIYQDNIDFSDETTDIKTLTFYLPQYHCFPENDEWWGKGFTEWVNVKNGDSRFEGHYQPRVPHSDIGYYCLDDIDVLRKQAMLAKQHGIYGFCFYYYWFSGKRLMEKPVDMLLENQDIDLPFCLCWANENWTRAWDGQNKNVLIAQEYSAEDDKRFIIDLMKYIDDHRYIRINGKPLIIVYNPGQIPNCKKTFGTWRETAKECGLGDILIWTCQTANNSAHSLGIENYIDAEVEFPPHNMWMEEIALKGVDLKGKSAFLYDYKQLVNYLVNKNNTEEKTKVPVHRSCMMAWDNAARRKDAWFTYCGFSLHSMYKWMLSIVNRTRKDFSEEERFVFINAWNEWGEGTYLEPDEKYGYANINTVSKAIFGHSFNDDIIFVSNDSKVNNYSVLDNNQTARIAVQVHMYYLDTLEETVEHLNNIPFAFDCYISTDTEEKKHIIAATLKEKCKCKNYEIGVYKNRGRDVAPFIIQMSSVIEKYDYIGHFHSKKTKTNDHGNEWREYIFDHLLGNEKYINSIFHLFEEQSNLGIIMPETYPVLELQAEWGGNKEGVDSLLNRLGIKMELPSLPIFPVGNMFWARTNAIKKIFMAGLTQDDFPIESGQVNATIAHQIERCWIYIAKAGGYTYKKVFNNCLVENNLDERKRVGIFVHYNQNGELSETDIATIKCYNKILDEIVFVSNSEISEEYYNKIEHIVSCIITRPNEGLDFGAWREAILCKGKEFFQQYDELVLFNNSCFAPVFRLEKMFKIMEGKNVDFWGNTIFPFSPDGSYLNTEYIPEHIQSYFVVFTNKVIASNEFWDFWSSMEDYDNLIDVIANCETKLTEHLNKAGFSYDVYIRETRYISNFLNNYSIPYSKPTSLLLLKNPLIKKKSYQYMDEEEKTKLEYYIKKLGSRI